MSALGAGLRLPVVAPLVDGHSRAISYLRVSLTDRCNYRCTYCMPEEGVELSPRAEVLRIEEIAQIVEAMCAAQGVEFRAPLKTSKPLQAVIARFRRDVATMGDDRYMANDLRAAANLIGQGELNKAAGEALPEIWS